MSDASMTMDERRARDFDEFTRSEGYAFSKATLAKFMRAIRASDEAAGLVLVPREATENMQQAGEYAWMHRNLNNPNSNPLQDCYRAMLAAATEAGGE